MKPYTLSEHAVVIVGVLRTPTLGLDRLTRYGLAPSPGAAFNMPPGWVVARSPYNEDGTHGDWLPSDSFVHKTLTRAAYALFSSLGHVADFTPDPDAPEPFTQQTTLIDTHTDPSQTKLF